MPVLMPSGRAHSRFRVGMKKASGQSNRRRVRCAQERTRCLLSCLHSTFARCPEGWLTCKTARWLCNENPDIFQHLQQYHFRSVNPPFRAAPCLGVRRLAARSRKSNYHNKKENYYLSRMHERSSVRRGN